MINLPNSSRSWSVCIIAAITAGITVQGFSAQIRSDEELENLQNKIQKLQSALDTNKSVEQQLESALNQVETERTTLQDKVHKEAWVQT